MRWNAQNYESTCGRVTEHGVKLVDILRNKHIEAYLFANLVQRVILIIY